MLNKIDVLDHGYTILHATLGDDLTVANAARVSYNKKKETLSKGDERLINFLARENHTSPFRHAMLQFEVYAPLMVARQWWKYIVGSSFQEASGDSMNAWNESSRRYVTEDPTFYIPQPDSWRSKPENSKQGSGKPLVEETGINWTVKMAEYVAQGERLYETAMHQGIAPEQARLFLPSYGMYVRFYWTASLQSVMHFIKQRTAHDSQVEIGEYAKAILEQTKQSFPVCTHELLNN